MYKSASAVYKVNCVSEQSLEYLRAYNLPKTNNNPRIQLNPAITEPSGKAIFFSSRENFAVAKIDN